MQRNATAYEASIATLWNHCDKSLVTVFQAFWYLLSGRRRDYNWSDTNVLVSKVAYKWRDFILINENILFTDYILKTSDVFIIDHSKLRFSILLGIHGFRSISHGLGGICLLIGLDFLNDGCIKCILGYRCLILFHSIIEQLVFVGINLRNDSLFIHAWFESKRLSNNRLSHGKWVVHLLRNSLH